MRKRPNARPCTNCALSLTTRADGVCQACIREARAKERREAAARKPDVPICTECRIAPTTREDGRCYGCVLALKDDNGTRGLEESHYDLDDHGHWATNARGVQTFVLGPPTPRRAAA